MKSALNGFLAKGDTSVPPTDSSPSDSDLDSMFGDAPNDAENPDDALKEALAGLGFQVDPDKLAQVKAILEGPAGEDDMNPADDVGGIEGGEGGELGGGAVPSGLKGRPSI
jgi:hypothetical protein